MADTCQNCEGQGCRYCTPKVITCDCGREVDCSGFTNNCECGADYNWNGTRLASRSQWGEETGETAADIMNCDLESDMDW